MRNLLPVTLLACLFPTVLFADGPADNIPANVRPVPPIGIELSAEDAEALKQHLDQLDGKIKQLKMRRDARTPKYLPDVEIFSRAMHLALDHREFYRDKDVEAAKRTLKEGISRADSLLEGKTPWTTQSGLVVRGIARRLIKRSSRTVWRSLRTTTLAAAILFVWMSGSMVVANEAPKRTSLPST